MERAYVALLADFESQIEDLSVALDEAMRCEKHLAYKIPKRDPACDFAVSGAHLKGNHADLAAKAHEIIQAVTHCP